MQLFQLVGTRLLVITNPTSPFNGWVQIPLGCSRISKHEPHNSKHEPCKAQNNKSHEV